MAGGRDALTVLRPILAALDDQALESLASKGLLRRAHKELEKGSLVVGVEATAEHVQVSIGEYVVIIPPTGPAAANCTCPANTVCQHILMAILHLQSAEVIERGRSTPPPDASEATGIVSGEDVQAEILAISTQALEKLVGRKAVRDALRLVSSDEPIEISIDQSIRVRFLSRGVECRYLAGAGLEGMICNALVAEQPKYFAAVVLALQHEQGVAVTGLEETTVVLQESAGAPRSRTEVIAAVRALLEQCVALGFSHLSESINDRLVTLAMSAMGAQLPRLSRTLQTLGDEVAAGLARNAQADEGRLLIDLARAYVLCDALSTPQGPNETLLVGQHRGQYDRTLQLDLVGLGAYVWRTRSGHQGLTVVFFNEADRQWYTWSDSRPETAGEFDPCGRYRQGGPWGKNVDPVRLSRSRMKLIGARRNEQNRLSSSEQCQAVLTQPVQISGIDFGERAFRSWNALRAHAARMYPVGLARYRASDQFVVVRPEHWGRPVYDEIRQVLRWPLLDQGGATIHAELAYVDVHAKAIENIESFKPGSRAAGLLAQITLRETEIVLYPISVLLDPSDAELHAVLNLGLDSLKQTFLHRTAKRLTPRPAAASTLESEESDPGEAFSIWSPAVAASVAELEEHIQRIAEAGTGRLCGILRERLAPIASRLEAAGLISLGRHARLLADGSETPACLLRLRYLCLLHRQMAFRMSLSPMASPAGGDRSNPLQSGFLSAD